MSLLKKHFAVQYTRGDKINWNNNIITNIMEQSPSWKANSFLASQEISHILRNPKVLYH